MLRESFWTPYQRHRDLVERHDMELEALHEQVLALEAETYFTRGGLRDCV